MWLQVFQGTALSLALRFSRTQAGTQYLGSVTVIFTEAAKLLICIVAQLSVCRQDIAPEGTLQGLSFVVVPPQYARPAMRRGLPMQEGMLGSCQAAFGLICTEFRLQPTWAMPLHCCPAIDIIMRQLYRLQRTWWKRLPRTCHQLDQAELICACAAATPLQLHNARPGNCRRASADKSVPISQEAALQMRHILKTSWPMLVPACLFVMQQVSWWNCSAARLESLCHSCG